MDATTRTDIATTGTPETGTPGPEAARASTPETQTPETQAAETKAAESPADERRDRAVARGGLRIPDRVTIDGLERKWGARWEAEGTYRFDRRRPRAEVYAIDTPPPTASGTLHVGHAFSYTHTDITARFQRMRGRAVFYPMGWDDNGLPTERRVENYFGVRCDPSLPYDPDFEPPDTPPARKIPISRPNFVELCHRLTAADEKVYEQVWRQIGLSVDWTYTYTTIGKPAQRVAQRVFLRQVERGEAYQAEAPVLWDVTFRTAVAQAEIQDRELPGAMHRLRFGDLEIETTRPELLPACVALVAHPEDERYRDRIGTTVRTPLFGVEVPVYAHRLADPDKGTGLAMICTFGDVTDVVWWRELGLPVRAVIDRSGRIVEDPPAGVPDGPAWRALAGKSATDARAAIVALLRDSGDLIGEPRPITHTVKFYEKGSRPLEVVTSRQWFIRLLDQRDRLLARGEELRWVPPFMRARYAEWVRGLNTDWLVSRQRFFGVPIPVWYAVRDDGTVDYDRLLLPEPERLPIDPSTDVPTGYTEEQRGRPGGFVGDPDVLDTWATSSLSPQIAGGWDRDPDLFARVFPMDLRPQGHEIIRTWLFYTVFRAETEHGVLPWKVAAISGWVLDPDRKKMSKSEGNVVTPAGLIDRYGADAFRYWAAGLRLGGDTAFDENQVRVGRRLAIKLLNAGRFVLARLQERDEDGERHDGRSRIRTDGHRETRTEGRSEGPADGRSEGPAEDRSEGMDARPGATVGGDGLTPGPEAARALSEPLDRALIARLWAVVGEVTASLDDYDHARALERAESFFWTFCDDYLELVKERAYGAAGAAGAESARAALTTALHVLLRLFAPYLPYVTEEAWSWWQEGSVHRAPWPEPPSWAEPGDDGVLDAAGAVLTAVRRAKSRAKRSMRAPVDRVTVFADERRLAAVRAAAADLRAAGHIARLDLEVAAEERIEVELAPE